MNGSLPYKLRLILKLRLGPNDNLLPHSFWYSKKKESISEKDFEWRILKDPGTLSTLYTIGYSLQHRWTEVAWGGVLLWQRIPRPVKVKRLDDWLRRFPEACPPSLIGWEAVKLHYFPAGSCCLATDLRPPAKRAPVTPVKRRLHQLTAALRFHLSRRLRARTTRAVPGAPASLPWDWAVGWHCSGAPQLRKCSFSFWKSELGGVRGDKKVTLVSPTWSHLSREDREFWGSRKQVIYVSLLGVGEWPVISDSCLRVNAWRVGTSARP